MIDEKKLEPCPFCGGSLICLSEEEKYPDRRNPHYWYYMECDCGAEGAMFDTEEEAEEFWNTRAEKEVE